MKLLHLGIWPLLFLIAACGSYAEGGPSRTVYAGDQRTAYFFQQDAATWDTFSIDNAAALFRHADATLEGAVVANRGYVWSLNNETHTNVIAHATIQMTEGAQGASYGLICRADAAGNGYYFLISSDGQYSIQVATPARNALIPLVDWQSSSAIKLGFQTNTVRAVCHDDYLALFVNDVFLAEVRDSQISQGALGVTLAAVSATAWVRFDDIVIQPTRG